MRFITAATRMWLTRSFKPFYFTNTYDNTLQYENLSHLGLYVHIPFCKALCDFCPYCKQIYQSEICNTYIDYLIKEIHLVGGLQQGKKQVTSLYFGGGSPSLISTRIHEIISVLSEYFTITEGIGIELHPTEVTVERLCVLKRAGVTKVSIGIQSFQAKCLSILDRKEMFDIAQIKQALSQVTFETVSMDFIFALPDQTIFDLIADIECAFASGANHIAVYPFIDFTFTKSQITAMSKKEKRKLLDEITLYCESKGYQRVSIWTFAKDKNAHYSSMTRDNFLGFGCSATTLLKDQFKVNTFSVDAYQKRIDEGLLPTSLTLHFTKRQRMLYYLFWTSYSTRLLSDDFSNFFGVSLQKMYGFELWIAQKLGFITVENGIYQMTLKGAFYYHYYENFYTLAYIDKMWGIMREQAFPKKLKF